MRRKPRRRTWTAVITVEGYNPMPASWNEADQHDDQIMQAAHDALRLMRKNGASVGIIDLFQDADESSSRHVERRTVRFGQDRIVVSAKLATETDPLRDDPGRPGGDLIP
jgi:hypothetical protein